MIEGWLYPVIDEPEAGDRPLRRMLAMQMDQLSQRARREQLLAIASISVVALTIATEAFSGSGGSWFLRYGLGLPRDIVLPIAGFLLVLAAGFVFLLRLNQLGIDLNLLKMQLAHVDDARQVEASAGSVGPRSGSRSPDIKR